METKKNPKIDLEHRRGLFLNLGLIISLSFIIMAFEWKTTYSGVIVDFYEPSGDMEVIVIPPTIHKPPPPPPKPVAVVRLIESEKEIEEDDILIDQIDFDDDFIVEDIVPSDPLPDEVVDEVITIAETMPSPVGGMSSFFNFVRKNLKYPNQARRMRIEGRVFVQFIVDKDGALTEVTVVKGIGAGCNEEAVRVMSMAPKWNPGKQRGKPVKVRMILPIHFRLG